MPLQFVWETGLLGTNLLRNGSVSDVWVAERIPRKKCVSSKALVRGIGPILDAKRLRILQGLELDERVALKLMAGMLRVGLTEDEVRAAVGNPLSSSVSVSEGGTSTEWVYGDTLKNRSKAPLSLVARFADGQLTEWEESKGYQGKHN